MPAQHRLAARVNVLSRRCFRRFRTSFVAMAAPSIMKDVPTAPPDPILGVTEAFKACTATQKLNLGVGAYRDDNLKPMVLQVVKQAEQAILARELSGVDNKEYLAMDGLASFNKVTAALLLGADSDAVKTGRVATIQALSGTGALRLGAAFIAKFMPGRTAYISDPTWGNHKNIFGDEKVEWKTYRYFNPATTGLDFEGMVADLSAAAPGSIVILHGCAHNPTGIDPSASQWGAIADVCASRSLVPFFDVAYQGFASGDLEVDAASVRLFASRGFEMFVSQSYSKNMGLYAERIGALNVLLADPAATQPVLSQLKRVARAMYSSPPVHGARLVAEILGDPKLLAAWKVELAGMAGRIQGVRESLLAALKALDPNRDWSFVTSQIGMFSFTGLSPLQVENMINKHKIFMTKDGRISLAGLNTASVPLVAEAIVDSFSIGA